MAIGLNKKVLISCLAVTTLVGLAGCGAGSKTAEKTSTKVACDFTNPPAATTVNVLAYNSSAVDPYSNTMVSSCTRENVTVKHDPIDFPGTGPEDDGDSRRRLRLLRHPRDLLLRHPRLR